MQLNGVMLFVAELEPMLAFYRDALGFRPKAEMQFEDWVEFDTAEAHFSLHLIPRQYLVKPSPAPRDMATCKPILAVDTLAGLRERLADAGATILDRPWGTWDFADPEGNVIGLVER
jgi:catechol 2,3-dioxygenase-like lactoylglutathione lyase family enzyme